MIPWQSRLRAEIILIAPNGGQFTATWEGDDITQALMVGQFNTPLRDGTITQPLGRKGMEFPLTLSFEGDNHDLDAFDFIQALGQRGPWAVTHPVYGQFILQPIGPFSLGAKPTSSGNISVVSGPWIEVPPDASTKGIAELGADTAAQIDAANASAAAQFQNATNLTDPEAQAAAAAAGQRSLGNLLSSGLYSIIRTAANLQASFTSAYNSLTVGLQATIWDGVNIYQQVQAIMAIPAVVKADLAIKIAAFNDFIDKVILTIDPNGSDSSATNAAAIDELYLSSAVVATVQAVVVSSPATRDQAVQAINDINAMFDKVTAALDAVQTATQMNTADTQYFSNGLSFADLARVVSMGVDYLLRLIFDLKVAKRFTLDRARHPGEIVIAEYAPTDSSTYDSLYDLFIAANKLIGDDIILLPAGLEVVVYV